MSQHHIHFGITELDMLINRGAQPLGGILLPMRENRPGATSISILGSDGTGKSILALHLACHYRAKVGAKGWCPKVLYVSTDLSFAQAEHTWQKFGLNDPARRFRQLPPFARPLGLRYARHATEEANYKELLGSFAANKKLKLKRYAPHSDELAAYLANPRDVASIAFIDAQVHTTGDDWLFLQRLVSLLEDPPGTAVPAWPHMLVIDAVEGLELLGGERDSFGEARTSRSRLAQLIRASRGKCHIVYVDEEPEEGRRLDTQYVSDIVVRVRSVQDGPYNRRTIEIEKARGHLHIRGQQDLVIRDGSGTTTGPLENPDDPRVILRDGKNLSYMHILRSVHSRSRSLLAAKGFNPPVQPARNVVCGFGIEYLDRLLPNGHREQSKTNGRHEREGRGLAGGTITALIGPMTTYKSRLGRAFLANAFAGVFDQLLAADPHWRENGTRRLRALTGNWRAATVLITHQAIDQNGLLREMFRHLRLLDTRVGEELMEAMKSSDRSATGVRSLAELLRSRVICRRLEMHHLSSAGFIHLIHSVVAEAQYAAIGRQEYTGFVRDVESQKPDTFGKREEKRLRSHEIRLVIDDWKAIKAAFPEAMNDPRLLPYILDFFRREGVTALILDTEQGVPLVPAADADTTLRALTDRHLYTWLVSFYDQRRVALTTVPPVTAHLPATIYELRPDRARDSVVRPGNGQPARSHGQDSHDFSPIHSPEATPQTAIGLGELDDERLIVDPHFEMYSGLEEGRTERVALRVSLYIGNRSDRASLADSAYMKDVRELFGQLFQAVPNGGEVVSAVDMEGYNLLKDYSYLQNGTRLEHTLVLQVDEFWAESHSSLYDLTDYMERTVQAEGDRSVQEIEDPYRVYQTHNPHTGQITTSAPAENGSRARMRRFNTETQGNTLTKYAEHRYRFDKVPYLWDFGFLLCNRQAWVEASKRRASVTTPGGVVTVRELWDALSPFQLESGELQKKHPPDNWVPKGIIRLGKAATWRNFFAALHQLKQRDEDVMFDVDLRTEEALSCFVLEVWFSEILNTKDKNLHKDFRAKLATDRSDEYPRAGSILELACCYPSQLWRALSMIYRFVPNLEVRNHSFVTKAADPHVFCARHWYSTASDPRYNDGERVPTRLPGNYTSRGDWFLSIAKGSRSPRLGEHAIDLLSSRRCNISRLLEGVGLPTRELYSQSDNEGARTALVHPTTPLFATPERSARKKILYRDVLRLCPQKSHQYAWIWRSTIFCYDIHSRTWLRWLSRMWTEGTECFASTTELVEATTPPILGRHWESWRSSLKLLIEMLKAASNAAVASLGTNQHRVDRFNEMMSTELTRDLPQ